MCGVRFASVYKGFEQVDDFARELGLLNKDATPQAARELRREERGTSGTATHERSPARGDSGQCGRDLRHPDDRSSPARNARSLGRGRERDPCVICTSGTRRDDPDVDVDALVARRVGEADARWRL